MPARPGDPAETTARATGRMAASRPASASTRASARRGWRQYWQIIPLAVMLWALDVVDKFRGGAQAAGLLHAPVINDISDRLGGSVAVVMNQWTSTHPLAAAPATVYYMVLQVLVTGTVGVLLLRSGHRSFGLHRNALIITGVIGLVMFWAYPVAPPRMLPGYHDTAAATVPIFHSLLETKAADQLASFPSLHVTWALWVAVATQSLARCRLWRAAVWAYPMLATVDVLATANHYLLDAATAPAVLALAYATAAALPALAPLLRWPTAARPPAGEPRAVAGHPVLLAAEGAPTQASPAIHASSGPAGSSRNQAAHGGGNPVRSAADTPTGGPRSSVVVGPGCHARPRTEALSGLSTIFPGGRTARPAAGPAASAGPGVTGHAARHSIRGGPGPALPGSPRVMRRDSHRPLTERRMSCTHHSPAVRKPPAHPSRPSRPALPVRLLRPSTCCPPAGAASAPQVAAALGLLTGVWVALSPWFIVLQYRGANATVTDVIAGLAAAAAGAAVLASPRGYPGLQFGSLLLGAWLIISPFVLDEKFPIAHPMYWSNSWSGGVLMALALASLAVLPRPAR